MLTDHELQSLRNMGNECEQAADEIVRLRAALQLIKESAESHPCFSGKECDGIDRDSVSNEGGDVAFVTLDIAWVAASALA
jgi:hypothetical protein